MNESASAAQPQHAMTSHTTDHTLYLMQMAGDSMMNAGIRNGDLLIVDKSATAHHGDIVAVVLDGEIAIKRLAVTPHTTLLCADNPCFADYAMPDGATPTIWGTVTDVIHPLQSSSYRGTTASASTTAPSTLTPCRRSA
ncbi:LexA family protein [Bifidobacterium olomucense]|uniref:Peptidase S24 n=1 Tax=Bifidobacterium olomucense TaxID=2675324 RepID=A0A7Y0HXF0_9BIFI|nr:S24 family peptidase [Bifidobacterium sp. DSM 109959]NMM98252.1 peptidase S24 [Bifidobacterium sp. DSM 109959]